MADTGIARVYQFLQQNYNSIEEFKDAADLNGDGKVIKTEFRAYLEDNFEWDGENASEKSDLINNFWKTLNVGGTKSNELEQKELDKAAEAMKASEQVDDFMTTVSVPSGVKNSSAWKQSVKNGLLENALNYLKSHTTIDDWNKEDAYNKSARKATADYVANEYIQEKLGNIDGYTTGDDATLSKIINQYIKSIADSELNLDEITAQVKALVENYYETAQSNSATAVSELEKYGYNSNGKLNDLQKAVLIKDTKKAITDKLSTDSNYKEMYANYKEAIEAKIPAFIEGKIKDAKAADMATLRGNIQTYVTEFLEEIADIEAEYKEYTDVKKALETAVTEQQAKTDYADDRKAAIKAVFGDDVDKKINSCKTLAEINALKAEFDKAIKEVDARLAPDFLTSAGLPASISCIKGGTFTPLQLTNWGGSYSTGELHFKQVNNACSGMTISDTGEITLNTNAAGQWIGKIEVYNNEGIKVAGPQEVTVRVFEKMTIGQNSGNFNGKSINSILNGSEDHMVLTSGAVNVFGTAIPTTMVAGREACAISAKQGLAAQLESLKKTLKEAGYDEAQVDIAATRTLNYYSAAIDFISRNCYAGSTSALNQTRQADFTYLNENGESVSESLTYINNTYSDISDVHNRRNSDTSGSGICCNVKYSGTDMFQITINSAVFLKKFESFYNM